MNDFQYKLCLEKWKTLTKKKDQAKFIREHFYNYINGDTSSNIVSLIDSCIFSNNSLYEELPDYIKATIWMDTNELSNSLQNT